MLSTSEFNFTNGERYWKKKIWPNLSERLSLLLIFLLVWGVAYTLFGSSVNPNTSLVRLIFLFVGAQICGIIVTYIKLPDMLGMLFWGIFYTNIGLGQFDGCERIEVFLREMALVNIMLLAGLCLDMDILKQLFGIIMSVTILPSICEVAIITIIAKYLLLMPWLWGLALGLLLTAISPNVVVSVLMDLKRDGYGLNKGIHTIIIAMCTCNDILSIFLFGLVIAMNFSTDNLSGQLLQGPIGIIIGICYGISLGLVLSLLPDPRTRHQAELKFLLVVCAGTLSVMGSKYIGYPSAGALGCTIVAIVIGMRWKRTHPNEKNDTSIKLDLLWKFLKPISFSLIGKEVNFSVLDGETIGYGVAVIAAGLLLRLGSGYLSLWGKTLNVKEKIYITLASTPKATVQATLGPVALDMAKNLHSTDDIIELATKILLLSVLAILLTAPIGALLMIKLAPVCLEKTPDENGPKRDDIEMAQTSNGET